MALILQNDKQWQLRQMLGEIELCTTIPVLLYSETLISHGYLQRCLLTMIEIV